MTLRFGTDGVRGAANSELTPELTVALGRAAARVVGARRWLIGRDTRRSGPLLAAALAAGLASEGADVADLGVLPTPGVAFASAAQHVPAAVISASHNPFGDNGIKLFAAGGTKIREETEQQVESQLRGVLADPSSFERPGGTGVGTLGADPVAATGYESHLVGALEGRRLDGLAVVVDCANGAASQIAPRVLTALGVDVEVLNADPDGVNINDGCGSMHPGGLQAAVRQHGADAGLALDGDADRVVAVDADGGLVDGDHIIAMCAIDLREQHRLTHDTVVVTVMTNLGFRLGMQERGIRVVETPVGDRYVLQAMEEGGYVLGGEQSGHVIFGELVTTGDGLLTGLQVLDLLRRSGRPLADLARAAMVQLPQVLLNVRVAQQDPAIGERMAADVEAAEHELGRRGRVLIRPSGTEPLVRVMVEAPSEDRARAVAERLAMIVERTVTG